MVVANWFSSQRELALAITVAGSSTGGFVMNVLGSRVMRGKVGVQLTFRWQRRW